MMEDKKKEAPAQPTKKLLDEPVEQMASRTFYGGVSPIEMAKKLDAEKQGKNCAKITAEFETKYIQFYRSVR